MSREPRSDQGFPDQHRSDLGLIGLLDNSAHYDPDDPAEVAGRRQRRRRSWIAATVVTLIVGGSICTYLPLVLLTPADAATVAVVEPSIAPGAAVDPALPVGVPAISVSVTGAEEFLGGPLQYAVGSVDPRPIASISKLITALVVLDRHPITADDPGPVITFSEADSDLYDDYYVRGATIQPMRAGSTMTEREALEATLIASASNYAEAVSTWAFGSQQAFRTATAAWLSANGMPDTTMVEPTGIDARNRSTPDDLLTLGRLALANPAVAEMVSTERIDLPGIGVIGNNNTLLGVDGVNGIKTGTLGGENGSNLLFSSTRLVEPDTSVQTVGVVLGGGSHDAVDIVVRRILDGIAAGFHEVPVVTAGQDFGSYSTPWGDEARIVAADDASVLTWSDTPVSATVTTTTVTTGTSGTEIGSVTFTAGPRTVTVPLVLDGVIGEPDEWWRVTHPAEILG